MSEDFIGMCKKDLAGKVIIYSDNKANMASQYIKFENAVYLAAGKTAPALTKAIDAKRQLVLKDFVNMTTFDPADYTTIDKDGNKSVDEAMEKIYKAASGLMIAKAVDEYTSYGKSSDAFYYRIKAQIDPETTTRMETSDRWPKINNDRDPGGLMKLLQRICVHGTDRDYLPERILNCLSTLLTTKQGKQTPSEFKESMTSNHNVFVDVAGVSIFSLMPALQEFVLDKTDDLNFAIEDLKNQSEDNKKRLADKCVDCILGCNMTLRSNKEKSDMNTEVHKSLLSKHGGAFAMNAMEAVDQMVGYEKIKTQQRSSSKIGGQGKDTKNAAVLFGFPHPGLPDDGSWHMDESGEVIKDVFIGCQIVELVNGGGITDIFIPGKSSKNYDTGNDNVAGKSMNGESRSDQLPHHHRIFYEEEKADDDNVLGVTNIFISEKSGENRSGKSRSEELPYAEEEKDPEITNKCWVLP